MVGLRVTEPGGREQANATKGTMRQWKEIQERISDCLNNKQTKERKDETMEDVQMTVQTAAEVIAIARLWKVLRRNDNAATERLLNEFVEKAYDKDTAAEIIEIAFPGKGAD
jgi:hypothetical protein